MRPNISGKTQSRSDLISIAMGKTHRKNISADQTLKGFNVVNIGVRAYVLRAIYRCSIMMSEEKIEI